MTSCKASAKPRERPAFAPRSPPSRSITHGQPLPCVRPGQGPPALVSASPPRPRPPALIVRMVGYRAGGWVETYARDGFEEGVE